jgi:hypothetical protein
MYTDCLCKYCMHSYSMYYRTTLYSLGWQLKRDIWSILSLVLLGWGRGWPERLEKGGPCWLLRLRWMGTQRVQMKGVLPWLVRWAFRAGTRDFWSALAAIVGSVQNIVQVLSALPCTVYVCTAHAYTAGCPMYCVSCVLPMQVLAAVLCTTYAGTACCPMSYLCSYCLLSYVLPVQVLPAVLFIIYSSRILCLSSCLSSCHIPVIFLSSWHSCGTLSYSLCFCNQTDQGDETEGL